MDSPHHKRQNSSKDEASVIVSNLIGIAQEFGDELSLGQRHLITIIWKVDMNALGNNNKNG